MSEPWSDRADLYRTSAVHVQGPDLDLMVEWAQGRRTALDVATGGGHVARRLREAGLEVVSCDPAPGMAPGRDLPRRGSAVRRPSLRRRRLPARGAPLRRHRAGGARDGAGLQRLVLLQDAVRVSDRVEEAERLRDPSHVRHYTEEEWRGYFAASGLDVEQAEHFVEHLDFDSWLARTGCEGETAERVRELLAAGDRGRRLELSLRRLQDGEAPLVAILVDAETRLVVQGLTGSEGRFHGLRNRAYGTNVVAGVTPGQGRPGRRGDPGLRHGRRGGRRDRGRHVAHLRPGAVRRRRDLRGRRRRHRHDHLHHRARAGARHAPALRVRRAPAGRP